MNRVLAFFDKNKHHPLLFGLASGLYPMLYLYNRNFTLINSTEQLKYFIGLYLVLPVIIGFGLIYLLKLLNLNPKRKLALYTSINLILFSIFALLSTIGIHQKKITLAIFTIAIIIGVLLWSQLKKILIVQYLLAIFVGIKLLPDLYREYQFYGTEEFITDTQFIDFEINPNIYLIQPDGYVNFKTLKEEPYSFDNSQFEKFVADNDFEVYKDFRSNYYSTLSSNVALFTMRHHYYNDSKGGFVELKNAREIIIGENSVLRTLKNNGYQCNLILDYTYMLINRPESAYDYCNIDKSEIPKFPRKYAVKKDMIRDLESQMKISKGNPQFYFIEKLQPGHIHARESHSLGMVEERNLYVDGLKASNNWLQEIINIINELDDNALIIIAADHGGFVGFEYSMQSHIKTTDENLINSIFSSLLLIKWPESDFTSEREIKTSVNVFRNVFAYLANDPSLLEQQEEDKSYIQITEGAPQGVYEYIDEFNNKTFKMHKN